MYYHSMNTCKYYSCNWDRFGNHKIVCTHQDRAILTTSLSGRILRLFFGQCRDCDTKSDFEQYCPLYERKRSNPPAPPKGNSGAVKLR